MENAFLDAGQDGILSHILGRVIEHQGKTTINCGYSFFTFG